MSLVVAIKDRNRIVLGADKQISLGNNLFHNSTKIWAVEELPGAIMGGVGLARASQIVQYSRIIDKNFLKDSNSLDTDYIVNVLTTNIAAVLKENGVTVDKAVDSDCLMMPNAFIFAYQDKAWMILNDFSVTEIEDYLAIGSGADVARGCLFTTMANTNPFDRIVTCIDAAHDSTLYVDNGLDILSTKILASDERQLSKALGIEQPSKPKKKKPKKKPVAKKPKEEVKDVGSLEK